MEHLDVAFLSIVGLTACLALLIVARKTQVRWQRIVLSVVALLGLAFQGVIWGQITLMFKALNVGGSYLRLYAALATSVVGMVWALVLLATSFLSRRSIG